MCAQKQNHARVLQPIRDKKYIPDDNSLFRLLPAESQFASKIESVTDKIYFTVIDHFHEIASTVIDFIKSYFHRGALSSDRNTEERQSSVEFLFYKNNVYQYIKTVIQL